MSMFESREDAERYGKKILKKLKGKGWKTRVWHNFGWHVEWQLERIRLGVYGTKAKPSFSVLIADNDNSGGGSGLWTTNNHSEDPNVVIEQDFKHALKVASDLRRGLTRTKKMLEAQ